ncbi:hypothetical protein B0T17DRAFT_535363 [Bombardia bombarda]|uniref:Uncharacterized protein n=1 Tax=Bombardia bombarda TaxID=252184 RepID=A0AA39WUQ5_9PEZI|nr:hypothetical protein B0T17DRAFT_535363 [Bombardia bombarda]
MAALPVEMAGTPTLDGTPGEVLAMMLLYMESPRQLFAAIRTHRSFYNAFRTDKMRILRQVIINAFGDNMKYALAFLNMPTFEDGDSSLLGPYDPQTPIYTVWCSKVDQFLANFARSEANYERFMAIGTSASEHRDHNDVKAALLPLYRLHNVVDEFMSEYIIHMQSMLGPHTAPLLARLGSPRPLAHETATPRRRAHEIFTRPTDPMQRKPTQPELTRIQRGFMLFECYCRLYSMPYWRFLGDINYKVPQGERPRHPLIPRSFQVEANGTSDFSRTITENAYVEELLCVSSYVQGQYRMLLGEMMRDCVQKVSRLSLRPTAPRPPHGDMQSPYKHIREAKEDHLWTYLVSPEHAKTDLGVHNILCGLGLGHLRRCLLLPDPLQRRRHLRRAVAAFAPGHPNAFEKAIGSMPNFCHCNTDPHYRRTSPFNFMLTQAQAILAPPPRNPATSYPHMYGTMQQPNNVVRSSVPSNAAYPPHFDLRSPRPDRIMDGLDKYRLRQAGWIFWDEDRVRAMLERSVEPPGSPFGGMPVRRGMEWLRAVYTPYTTEGRGERVPGHLLNSNELPDYGDVDVVRHVFAQARLTWDDWNRHVRAAFREWEFARPADVATEIGAPQLKLGVNRKALIHALLEWSESGVAEGGLDLTMPAVDREDDGGYWSEYWRGQDKVTGAW